jgi:hypothetical protein
VIRANFEDAQLEVALALGQHILVEEQLLGRIQAAVLAAADRILLALLHARIVVIIIALYRHAGIDLLDLPAHLGVKLLLERLRVLQGLLKVGVFGVEVGEHCGVRALA